MIPRSVFKKRQILAAAAKMKRQFRHITRKYITRVYVQKTEMSNVTFHIDA